jgi:hypothetical protein
MASCTSMGAALSECLLLPIYCLSVSDTVPCHKPLKLLVVPKGFEPVSSA